MRIEDEIFCFAHRRWCHNGWASNILIVVDTGYAGIHHTKYWMPIHYDTIEDGQNKKSLLLFSNCTMCTASIRFACTAIHACTVQCECSVAIRVYYYTALHVGFTFLVHMSNCMQCLIFFTCVSFVLYLKFIKYQIYYGLIFYLSLNDSLNLKSPPAIAITCKMTQQITNSNNK